jgi:protein gp37
VSTAIEWTDETWNPVTGCTKVSPGCDHCYAERVTERFHGRGSFERVVLHPERLDKPLRWSKPRKVFVNSMSDLFHEQVPDEFIAEVFAVMALAPQHTFQVLTKRHGRMRSLLSDPTFGSNFGPMWAAMVERDETFEVPWPLPNVWLGVSVEDQRWADIRIPALLDTPAAVRFVSAEPLLGPVRLRPWVSPFTTDVSVDWVIVGGESGPGARPMHPDWARSIRDQCGALGVPFLFKQWGGRTPKAGGRELDSRTWDGYPQAVAQGV